MPITVMVLRLVQPGPSEFTTNHLDVILGCDGTPFFMRYLFHPVTIINLLICGSLGVIEFVHTKAHHTLEQDVHGHVHRALQKNPELARSTCWELE